MSIAPSACPNAAKASDTPPSVKATGYPASSNAQTATTIRMAMSSGSGTSVPTKDRKRSRRLRNTLQREEQGKNRNERLEQKHQRQAARLTGPFQDRPGALHIWKCEPDDRNRERQKQKQRPEEIDPCLDARRCSRIKHVHAHMAAFLQGPG